MGGYVVCADVHIGNHRRWGGPMVVGMNTRCRMAVSTLQSTVAYCLTRDATLLVAGDLFDDDRPLPQVIAAVNSVLEPLVLRGRIVCMRGNHDMRTSANGDNALCALRAQRFDEPFHFGVLGERSGFMIPFQPGPAVNYITEAVKHIPAGTADRAGRILVIHAGIRDANTPWYLQSAEDAIDIGVLIDLCKRHGFDTVYAGNWHKHWVWDIDGVKVVQVGSLCPTGMDDTSPLHGAWDDQLKVLREIAGPRFAKVSSYDEFIEEAELHKGVANHFYCVLTAETESQARAAETQYLLLPPTRRALITLEIELSSEAAYTAARAAASAATNADNRDEAVAAYIAAMPLAEGVDRDRVLARTRGFLK